MQLLRPAILGLFTYATVAPNWLDCSMAAAPRKGWGGGGGGGVSPLKIGWECAAHRCKPYFRPKYVISDLMQNFSDTLFQMRPLPSISFA